MFQYDSVALILHEHSLKPFWVYRAVRISCAAATSPAEAPTHLVKDVGTDTYDSELEQAGSKLVVLDMYTQWYVVHNRRELSVGFLTIIRTLRPDSFKVRFTLPTWSLSAGVAHAS